MNEYFTYSLNHKNILCSSLLWITILTFCSQCALAFISADDFLKAENDTTKEKSLHRNISLDYGELTFQNKESISRHSLVWNDRLASKFRYQLNLGYVTSPTFKHVFYGSNVSFHNSRSGIILGTEISQGTLTKSSVIRASHYHFISDKLISNTSLSRVRLQDTPSIWTAKAGLTYIFAPRTSISLSATQNLKTISRFDPLVDWSLTYEFTKGHLIKAHYTSGSINDLTVIPNQIVVLGHQKSISAWTRLILTERISFILGYGRSSISFESGNELEISNWNISINTKI